jgi:glycosyltransferase involved in cell wall biosynthesis
VIIGKSEVSPDPPRPDERTIFLDYTEASELVKFYSYADMLVQPSLAEGFGLTVLEAMACGTAVLCSTAGSLPEVAGDAGILFAPHDREALARSILMVIGDQDLRRHMQQKGLVRAEAFSWERAGSTVLASCQKASKGSP